MKKLFFTTAILFLAIATGFSQFNSGSKMVGASSSLDFSFTSEKDEGATDATKTTEFDLTPRFAYFLQNRIALGGDLTLNYQSQKFGSSESVPTTVWSIGPFARYYHKTVSWFVPFAEIKAGYGMSSTKDFTGTKTKHNIFYAGAGVGAAIFLADNFALEALLAYNYQNSKNPEGGGSHSTNGVMLQFGFSFFFNSLLQE